ncbi:uncharacterized protein LOC123527013 [Mercenaria mercenaria]|uniref:uncharacterized protein LOC123527013 n=1 Tax=Mercenaria mercenaria TaxID=6596 RepID=UPI00234F474D|nr:uncharacterized protein LOC123527013 [Mercenaria mercenaria]
MPALDGLAGIVFGAIFGSVFVITCIISAIKAVRDRSRIKKRRAIRKENHLGNGYVDGEKDYIIEEILPEVSCSSLENKSSCYDNLSNGTSRHEDIKERIDLSVYTINTGVENLTFQHSDTNIKCTDEHYYLPQQNSKAVTESRPFCQSMIPKSVKSHDANYRRKRKLDHLSSDCLAIKKSMRRHSYEIAVCENSWLPKEPPCFAPSTTIQNAFSYGVNVKNDAKSPQIDFENISFDKNDYKKT